MKKTKYFRVLILVFITLLLLIVSTSCNGNEEDDRLVVAVSVVPQSTFVNKVAGDLVRVVTLVPPGYSPENFEPTIKQTLEFNKSAIFFSIGVPAEVAFTPHKDTKVVALHNIARETYPDLISEGERDPHIWLSPKRAIIMVETIASELALLDPENQTTYRTNAANYIAELTALDAEISEMLEPLENRKFLVLHPAFGYFAHDYSLEMYALEKEGKEPDPTHMQQMLDLAMENDIKVIFYQAEHDSKQATAFAGELGGKAVMLAPLSPDYINNLRNMASTIAEVMI